jgi:hypothetical protein
MGAQRITNCVQEILLFQKGGFWLEKPTAGKSYGGFVASIAI